MHYKLNLNIEPTTSLDEVLNFIDRYGYKSPIEFKNFYFEDGIEFKYKNSLEFFHGLLHLHLESAIDLEIKGNCENEMGRKNKEINNFLKENIEIDVISPIKLFSSTRDKKYSILFIERGIKYFDEHIKYGDYLLFSINIVGYQLLNLLFNKIHHKLGYENIKHRDISQNLYNNILEQTGGKNNFLDKITIFYHFYNDYIKDNRIILPLLSELEEKGKLKIKNIKLEDEYIYFEFDRINDISEKLFIETADEIIKISDSKGDIKLIYAENNFTLNNKHIVFKSKKSKIYQIFLLAFDSFNKYKRNHVSFDEIHSVLLENEERYSTISSKDLANYDSNLRKSIQEKNNLIENEFKIEKLIGINKDGISCEYYIPEEQ